MKRFFLIGSVLALAAISIFSLYISDAEAEISPKPQPFILDSKIIDKIDLGLHNAASDMIWISTIQYFGDNTRKEYPKLLDYLSTVVSLDPLFSRAYSFGLLNLPGEGNIDQAIFLGQTGLDRSVTDWEVPYYLATTYHIFKRDQQAAAKYLQIAADTKGAPSNISYIAANYGSSGDDRNKTILIWQGIYENSNDLDAKDKAEKYLSHFLIMNILDDAAIKYFGKTGNFPKTPDELLFLNILREIPSDPLGFKFIFNEKGQAVLSE